MKIAIIERNNDEIYKNINQVAKQELVKLGQLIDVGANYIEEKFDAYLFSEVFNKNTI